MPLDRDDEDDSLLVDDSTNEDDYLVVDSQEDNLHNHHDLTCDLRGDMYVVNSICDVRLEADEHSRARIPPLVLNFFVKWNAPWDDPSHDSWEPFMVSPPNNIILSDYVLSNRYKEFASTPEFISWAKPPRAYLK